MPEDEHTQQVAPVVSQKRLGDDDSSSEMSGMEQQDVQMTESEPEDELIEEEVP